jgi:hypothetical protein
MRNFPSALSMLLASALTISCSKTDGPGDTLRATGSSGGSGVASAGAGGNGNGGNPGGAAGTMTAGEWNDLNNWDYWNNLLQRDSIKTFPGMWGFYTKNRVTVILKDVSNNLVHDAKISLSVNGNTVSARTDNFGKAELFPGLFDPTFSLSKSSPTLTAEYKGQYFNLGSISFEENVITKTIPLNKISNNTFDVMFVVDATGSMSDELSYLKTELRDVINRAGSQLSETHIKMGSVFYRDLGDEYLTRPFDFTSNPDLLNSFINNQIANGGGDYPEAVDEALKVSIQDQSWSPDAINRILFLILDAPPHKTPGNLAKIEKAISDAQGKGIRIIPISASGIDWETEFFLRFLSVSTNGTYVFITDHSGIGNAHFTPTVGHYDVEFLNNLMVRLITKYGQDHD